jgi:hypothetical protein
MQFHVTIVGACAATGEVMPTDLLIKEDSFGGAELPEGSEERGWRLVPTKKGWIRKKETRTIQAIQSEASSPYNTKTHKTVSHN